MRRTPAQGEHQSGTRSNSKLCAAPSRTEQQRGVPKAVPRYEIPLWAMLLRLRQAPHPHS
ncbi:hypothetical protein CGRA01v4_01239 [Colletotrichum graminicola]|nr:hypothetical protein CGRA01v4_01239 [Colletotrichum graminicola]